MNETIYNLAKKLRGYSAEVLSEIVKLYSPSGGEKQVIDKLASLCEDAGFHEIRTDNLGNLICSIGKGDKTLAFDAHIDVVDTGDLSQWELPPFSGLIKDGYVHGRGTVDQKGGAASMITAGKILKTLGYESDTKLVFTFTVMEEDCDGLCWKYLIEKEKIKPDYVVITEPTNLNIYRGHRGRLELELLFKGVSAHGSMPERGVNAVYKAAKVSLAIQELNNLLRKDDFLGKGSVTVTEISSVSPSLCAVPDKAKLHLDRRLTWGENFESVKEELLKICDDMEITVPIYSEKSYKDTVFEMEKYFPTWKFAADHPWVKTAVKAYQEIFAAEPVVDKWHFSTNGVTIAGMYGIPTIGFGPGNEIYAHAPNEKIPVEHLVKASAFYTALAMKM